MGLKDISVSSVVFVMALIVLLSFTWVPRVSYATVMVPVMIFTLFLLSVGIGGFGWQVNNWWLLLTIVPYLVISSLFVYAQDKPGFEVLDTLMPYYTTMNIVLLFWVMYQYKLYDKDLDRRIKAFTIARLNYNPRRMFSFNENGSILQTQKYAKYQD